MNKDILPVLDEISALLKRHDMVGLVIVGNETHCDWRIEVAASWSCAWVEKEAATGRDVLRIRAKRTDYRTAEAQKRTVEATVGTFVTFGHTLKGMDEQLDKLLVAIAGQVDFLGKSTDET